MNFVLVDTSVWSLVLCKKELTENDLKIRDFLICSVARNHNFSIFTLDNDFLNYKKYIDFNLIDLNAI